MTDTRDKYLVAGSNTVKRGEALDLSIKISSATPDAKIALSGSLSITNLDEIISQEEIKKGVETSTWKLKHKPEKADEVELLNFDYDDNLKIPQCSLPRRYSAESDYIVLELKGGLCKLDGESAAFKLEFFDLNESEEDSQILTIPVQALQKKVEIEYLIADPSVLQGNQSRLSFSWSIKGENYNYRILDGLKEIHSGQETNDKTDTYSLPSASIGDHRYTLEVTQGKNTISQSKHVRALDTSGPPSSKCNPPKPRTILNFCTGQYSNYLFALIINEITKKIEIGYTAEGFSGDWSKIALSESDEAKLKSYANSSMVHLKDAGATFGRIYFVGGSGVKAMDCFNTVAVVDLDSNADDLVHIIKDCPWDARMGHSCVVFPHGGADKIWLLGGVDEWGGALNDVWVSGNGLDWTNLKKDGTANTNSNPVWMDWDARCLAGVTIELDEYGAKKALWLAGGFREVGGEETPDIWKWEGSSWSKIGITINDGNYMSSGLAFLGKDTLQSTGVYLMGGFLNGANREKFFYKINKNNRSYSTQSLSTSTVSDSFATTKEARVITAFFKNSLWYLVFTNEGDKGLTYSKLFYFIPTVTDKTILI